MSDYIKRDDVKDAVLAEVRLGRAFGMIESRIINAIGCIPSADVREVKHGHWEVVHSAPWSTPKCWDILKCSECGHTRCTDSVPNFCEHCGADMREERNR